MNPSTLPALIALLCALAGGAPAAASAAPVRAAEGLWAYTGPAQPDAALTVWENNPPTAPEKP